MVDRWTVISRGRREYAPFLAHALRSSSQLHAGRRHSRLIETLSCPQLVFAGPVITYPDARRFDETTSARKRATSTTRIRLRQVYPNLTIQGDTTCLVGSTE